MQLKNLETNIKCDIDNGFGWDLIQQQKQLGRNYNVVIELGKTN